MDVDRARHGWQGTRVKTHHVPDGHPDASFFEFAPCDAVLVVGAWMGFDVALAHCCSRKWVRWADGGNLVTKNAQLDIGEVFRW